MVRVWLVFAALGELTAVIAGVIGAASGVTCTTCTVQVRAVMPVAMEAWDLGRAHAENLQRADGAAGVSGLHRVTSGKAHAGYGECLAGT